MTKPTPTPDNDRVHYEFLKNKDDVQWPIKYLYDRLNILDSKTSALLRFNGVMLGFVAVLALRIIESKDLNLRPHPGWYLGGCVVILLLLTFAEWQAFKIFSLQFDRINPPTRTLADFENAFFETTCLREKIYASVLTASKIGGLLFVLLILALILESDKLQDVWDAMRTWK
jgi:hypothetical protein